MINLVPLLKRRIQEENSWAETSGDSAKAIQAKAKSNAFAEVLDWITNPVKLTHLGHPDGLDVWDKPMIRRNYVVFQLPKLNDLVVAVVDGCTVYQRRKLPEQFTTHEIAIAATDDSFPGSVRHDLNSEDDDDSPVFKEGMELVCQSLIGLFSGS
jgi:hypothetical protein